MANKNLWTEYNGKGFGAEYADYAVRATKDEDGNDIVDNYATKAEVATTYATKESVEAKQDSLTFGYNSNNQIVSIDSHDLAPSADSTVYLANYGSTRGDAVGAALQAGKAVMCKSFHDGDYANPKFGLLGTYNRVNNQYQYTFIRKTTNIYEQATGDIAFTSVFNNSAGASWFGQHYNLTFKAPTAEGQVMKSVNVNNSHFDWALATVREVPSSTSSDSGKVLKVNQSGSAEWAEAGSGLPDPTESDSLLLGQSDGSKAWNALSRNVMGTPLLDESNRPILDENSNPVYDANSTTDLWTSFAGHEFGARRAYADQEGNNIKATYARKEVLDDLASALDTINDTLESVSHGGMYDLGDKTEADLINGKLSIGCGNSTTTLTLTTVNAVTILANSGVPNFALLIDNSGNSNAVTVTVKDSTDTTTFLYSVSSGNEVDAGKIYQLTCVGKCWTLAEYGTANA
jgi:hypothetical protein